MRSLSWVMAVIGVIATVMNAQQIAWCFMLYGITNIYWTYHNLVIREYAQASLCGIYLLLSVWGFWNWQ